MKKDRYFVLWLRRRIIAGLLVLVPTFVTLLLTGFLYIKLTDWAVRVIGRFAPELIKVFWFKQSIRITTLLIIIILLIAVGEFARFKLGRYFLHFAEWTMLKLPLLSTIYSTTRQIGDALWTPKGNMFRKAVLVEYPRRGVYAIGFLTSENKDGWEVGDKTGKQLISIFLPTTPNPTSGFLLLLPKEDCIFLDMKVADAMRLVISGGAVKSHENEFVVSDEEGSEIKLDQAMDVQVDQGAAEPEQQ